MFTKWKKSVGMLYYIRRSTHETEGIGILYQHLLFRETLAWRLASVGKLVLFRSREFNNGNLLLSCCKCPSQVDVKKYAARQADAGSCPGYLGVGVEENPDEGFRQREKAAVL